MHGNAGNAFGFEGLDGDAGETGMTRSSSGAWGNVAEQPGAYIVVQSAASFGIRGISHLLSRGLRRLATKKREPDTAAIVGRHSVGLLSDNAQLDEIVQVL